MKKSKPPAPKSTKVEENAKEFAKPAGNPLKPIAGSSSAGFNSVLLNAVTRTLFLPPSMPEEQQTEIIHAALVGVAAFNPRDAVEGMMAAQAVAMHHAAMECARRAMLPEQTSDAADRLRRQAAYMSRAMVDMAEAIDRRRGKGPHIVRVERVVVHEGGQAIVGAVAHSKAGGTAEEGSHAQY